MKHFRLIIGTTLVLFIIGSLTGTFLLKITEKILGREILGFSTLSSFMPSLSFGFLLAFCSICAGCVLWAYSKANAEYAPGLVFGLGLLVSVASAIIGIGLKLGQIRLVLNSFGNEPGTSVLSSGSVNYFSWGFGLPLFVNIIIIAVLLLISHQKQQQKDNSVATGNN
jgi:hypothetical protein